MIASALRGTLGFTAVGSGAFSLWAFGRPWFHGWGGEVALYAAIAAVFIRLTGLRLPPLGRGSRRIQHFYGAFAPAWRAYALIGARVGFWLQAGLGEWLGAQPFRNGAGTLWKPLLEGRRVNKRAAFLDEYNFEPQFLYPPNVGGSRTDAGKRIRYPHSDGRPDREMKLFADWVPTGGQSR
jgi:hypothetical protein